MAGGSFVPLTRQRNQVAIPASSPESGTLNSRCQLSDELFRHGVAARRRAGMDVKGPGVRAARVLRRHGRRPPAATRLLPVAASEATHATRHNLPPISGFPGRVNSMLNKMPSIGASPPFVHAVGRGRHPAAAPSATGKQRVGTERSGIMLFNRRWIIVAALASLFAALLLVPRFVESGQTGAVKLEGAWIAKVTAMDGVPPSTPLPFQWSYVLAPSPSGRSASIHGSVDVAFPESIASDSHSPIIGEMVQTGPNTVVYTSIWSRR